MKYDAELRCYLEPCRFCGDEVRLYDGVRTYDLEGFPYVHVCPQYVLKPAGEREYEAATPKPPRVRKPPVMRVKDHGGLDL